MKPSRLYQWPHLLFFTLAVLLAGTSYCRSQENDEVRTYHVFGDQKRANAIVATVGPINVTAQEFLLAYEFGPAFVKRGNDSKKRHLQYMINEKLLALDAHDNGLERLPVVTGTLKEIEGDLMTEELYKDDILSKVAVSEREIDRAVEGEQKHITLRWLYAPTEEGIGRSYSLLLDGVPFDSLFNLQVRGNLKADDRTLETTRFKLRKTNPTFAELVDTLLPHTVSSPIKGPDGWYVASIVDAWQNAIVTESEMAKMRHDAQTALIQQKADTISDRYVQTMMLERNPIIVRTTFNRLCAYLGKKVVSSEKFAEWNLLDTDTTDMKFHFYDTLVTLKDGLVDLREFLGWYSRRETAIRLSVASERAFSVSMEQMVWRMVRDRLLVERAKERNLSNREIVKTQTNWWKQKILFDVARLDMGKSIAIDDQTAQAYYAANQSRYARGKSASPTFEDAKGEVRKDLYSSELTKKMLHKLTALRQKYKVAIHDSVLKSIPVDVENQSKAIDVYSVKKGGTFPRAAFPTIDYEWKGWE